MVEIAVEVAAGRVPVIAGAGSNSTAEAIELTRHAKEAGADAALVVTPYYNKPTQEGLYLHFTAIADAVDLPIIIYNIPPRSVVDMSVETMARLAKHRNIVGVKDATANLARPLHTRQSLRHRVLPAVGRGPHRARLPRGRRRRLHQRDRQRRAPSVRARCTRPGRRARPARAMAIQDRLLPLHDALFAETSPGPVKFAASLLGHGTEHCRLPLAPLAAATRERVRGAMQHAGLLNYSPRTVRSSGD